MKGIQIQCPTCKKRFNIEVSEDIFKENMRGIFAINIDNFSQKTCSHSFVVYLDKNFAVRDYLITDFKLELPVMEEVEQKKERFKVPSKDLIDVYLLTINFNAFFLTLVLRACFHKKKILILWDRDFLKNHIMNFFKFIFEDTFKIDISLEKRKSYDKNKKKFKDHTIIDNDRVINDKNGILKPKTIKIEQVIVQKFLAENDPQVSLIVIKNEIKKAYKLSKEVIEFNNNLKKNEEFTIKRILVYFQEVRKMKINRFYLDFLLEIINYYFNIEISQSSKTSNFFGF